MKSRLEYYGVAGQNLRGWLRVIKAGGVREKALPHQSPALKNLSLDVLLVPEVEN